MQINFENCVGHISGSGELLTAFTAHTNKGFCCCLFWFVCFAFLVSTWLIKLALLLCKKMPCPFFFFFFFFWGGGGGGGGGAGFVVVVVVFADFFFFGSEACKPAIGVNAFMSWPPVTDSTTRPFRLAGDECGG